MAGAARFHSSGEGAVRVASDRGGICPPGGDFAVLRTHLNGVSTGSVVSPFLPSHSEGVITCDNIGSGRSGQDHPPGDAWADPERNYKKGITMRQIIRNLRGFDRCVCRGCARGTPAPLAAVDRRL
jgi:hypothetical protein